MLQTRYEEYGNLSDQIPCVFSPCLERTDIIYSQQSNWHENIEIEVCMEGAGYVLLDGIRHSIQTGDIVVVNSNVVHYTGTEQRLVYSCLIIDGSFCRAAGFEHTRLEFETLFRDDIIRELFAEITEITKTEQDVCRHAKLQIALLNLLVRLRQFHTISDMSNLQTNSMYENVKQAIHYIRENYNKTLSLDMIARYTASDKYNLCRNFKTLTGQTIVQYINTYRCMRAMDLIRDGSSIQEAAFMCGFHNMSYFTRTFRQYTGNLPSWYKN